jgi:transposase-like protein
MSKRSRSARVNASNGKITNMTEFFRQFGTEEKCESYMFSQLYPQGFRCPKCGHDHCSKIAGRREYQCSHCGYQFSLTTGTVMENTKLPLSKWFLAAFLIVRDKRGISGMQLARELEVSDRTAYFVLQRIRSSMAAKECHRRAFI